LKCWYGERLPAHPVDTRIPVDPVSFETFDWKPRAPEMHSRAEVEHPKGPYEAAVTTQIADWDPRISSGDSADIEDATRQLVEFDKHAQRMLGTDNPALGPMTAILLRAESASSSQIEQLTTSAKPGRERALAQSILRNKGLVSSTAVPISAGLLVPVDRYFAALGAFRSGDAGPIIREFARASRIAAATGTKLVDDLVAQLGESRARLQGLRSDAAAWKVLPALVGQPAVNTKYLTNGLGIGEMAALRALEALTERGVLTEMTGRARGRVWQHRGIFDVLDGYAAEIRRMSLR
jgi:hypothetical protein